MIFPEALGAHCRCTSSFASRVLCLAKLRLSERRRAGDNRGRLRSLPLTRQKARSNGNKEPGPAQQNLAKQSINLATSRHEFTVLANHYHAFSDAVAVVVNKMPVPLTGAAGSGRCTSRVFLTSKHARRSQQRRTDDESFHSIAHFKSSQHSKIDHDFSNLPTERCQAWRVSPPLASA